jgi:pimeloyl-ACP methyl ester carboxylesterase
MEVAMTDAAIFVPGIITPAEIAFGELRKALGSKRPIVLHDLAVYDSTSPPPDYGLDYEVAGILAAADSQSMNKFHLVGFSAGGAASIAFASRHGDRLKSLTLIEPAWLTNEGMSEVERDDFQAAISAAELPGGQAIAEFARLNLVPEAEPPPPPPGEPPPWMALRPAAIRAIGPAFLEYDVDPKALATLNCPVLYLLGTLSAKMYELRSERARDIFEDFTLEIFEGRHHFDPPHRAEPERVAGLLQNFWSVA